MCKNVWFSDLEVLATQESVTGRELAPDERAALSEDQMAQLLQLQKETARTLDAEFANLCLDNQDTS